MIEARAAVIAALRDSKSDLDVLARVIRACVGLLPVDGASISVLSGPRERETLYASDVIAMKIENVQFDLGEGPCFEAFATRRPVLVPDLPQASVLAWPVFAAAIAALPVGAIFAFPLQAGAIGIGAIDLYRRRPGWLSADELAVALEVVDVVTAVLLGVLLGEFDGADGLRGVLSPGREQVHQATGMVLAALGISAEEALSRLRGYAFATGRPLDEVAKDIVNRELSPLELRA
ncbi:GAF and ANTAR domain-containing protein [Lentzea sp. HUAS12]|uniref:GAF and ANTAR domain-containing protein n=1 Tax=Lentzea sp. HUAS12 TaxID=2951806 RepID=UPI0020A0560F|nr:GAF and ANTAR domain-containing protein [Lentzea sp. HUAS12]USX54070.1 GAF and ANTAR domain-containing protein [Lentzea sp. HUAS12]